MPAEIQPAQGERETLGIVKETSFATFPGTTGMVWHPFVGFQPKLTDTQVARMPRGSLYAPVPARGGRSAAASLDIEGAVDTIGQLFSYALGTQTVPTTAIVNTTITAGTSIGANSFAFASTTNVFPGMILTFDTSTNLETLTVKTVSGLTVTTTTNATKAHANGIAVTCTATTAYASTIKGASLPTFSIQRNTVAVNGSSMICRDYLGCKVDSMSLTLSAKANLAPKFSLVYVNEATDASPAAATLSTKNPIVFDMQASAPIFGASVIGTGTEASVLGASITVANNLTKDYFSLGNGPLVRAFPENMRKVSGSLTLDFATTTAYNQFMALSANGNKVLVSLTIPLQGTDTADATLAVPFANTLYVPNCYLSAYDGSAKPTGTLQQMVTFEGSESTPGASDALVIYHIGSSATVY